MSIAETRLNVRLAGPLAEHVNRQIESALYSSHSEYIRDLVRRDMAREDNSDDRDLAASVSRGLADIEHGRYTKLDGKAALARSMSYAGPQGKK